MDWIYVIDVTIAFWFGFSTGAVVAIVYYK